jgi:hypothetical protein
VRYHLIMRLLIRLVVVVLFLGALAYGSYDFGKYVLSNKLFGAPPHRAAPGLISDEPMSDPGGVTEHSNAGSGRPRVDVEILPADQAGSAPAGVVGRRRRVRPQATATPSAQDQGAAPTPTPEASDEDESILEPTPRPHRRHHRRKRSESPSQQEQSGSDTNTSANANDSAPARESQSTDASAPVPAPQREAAPGNNDQDLAPPVPLGGP